MKKYQKKQIESNSTHFVRPRGAVKKRRQKKQIEANYAYFIKPTGPVRKISK